MIEAVCSGTPREIGLIHGKTAKDQVAGSLLFYEAYFLETVKLDWKAACDHAIRFIPFLKQHEPQYLEELEGLASGADVPFESILALNVRTEIVYGLSIGDGCTALSWHQKDEAFLAQNWDWRPAQGPNLIKLIISRPGHKICMLTEAGIIGKIGMNSRGVGVCLNAIRVPGVNYARLPVHLALRKILDHEGDLQEIIQAIEQVGVASSAHILAASDTVAYGLEVTHRDTVILNARKISSGEVITHTNHLLVAHKDVKENLHLRDTIPRLARIDHLLSKQENGPSLSIIQDMLKDQEGYPGSICRDTGSSDGSATVFSIVMDLRRRRGHAKLGRPTDAFHEVLLDLEIRDQAICHVPLWLG